MLIEINLPEGPLLMFAIAVVIVSVIFLFLAGVFAMADIAAAFFEKRPIVPGIFCWYISCCTVFLVNLGFVWVVLWLFRMYEQKEAEAFVAPIVDLPFYLGVPGGLIAVTVLTLFYFRTFDRLVVRKLWRAALSLVSSVTLTFAIVGLLNFAKGVDFMGLISLALRLLNSDIGFYLIPALLVAGFFLMNYKRLTQHANFVISVNARV